MSTIEMTAPGNPAALLQTLVPRVRVPRGAKPAARAAANLRQVVQHRLAQRAAIRKELPVKLIPIWGRSGVVGWETAAFSFKLLQSQGRKAAAESAAADRLARRSPRPARVSAGFHLGLAAAFGRILSLRRSYIKRRLARRMNRLPLPVV